MLLIGAGALCGLVAFSRAIGWLLKHYHQPTLLLIKGILIGSLWMIWPFQDREYELLHGKQKLVSSSPAWPTDINSTTFVSLAFLLAGFMLVLLIHRLSGRQSKP
jgi:putative membrane protein